MTAITFTATKPNVGGSADTWGGIINTGLDQIKTDLDMLNASPTARILGRNDPGTGEIERLTGAEVTAMLDALAPATQAAAGTQGVAPTPPAASQYSPLCGNGQFRRGVGRQAGCTIVTTNVNGSQPTLTGALNAASVSVLTVVGALSAATVTFTDPMPTTNYQVHSTGNGVPSANGSGHDTKNVGSVRIYWDNTGGAQTQIDVSVFAG